MQLLQESGEESLSLREVARRAGVTSAAPYHHFSDKDALLAAIAEEGYAAFKEDIQRALVETATPGEELAALARVYLHSALARPAYFRVMFLRRLLDLERYPSLYAASKVAFHHLIDKVSRARPDLSPEEVLFVGLSAWSMMHGFALLWSAQMFLDPMMPGFNQAAERLGKLLAAMVAHAPLEPR
jgi:AcrR family transcriptional regulator